MVSVLIAVSAVTSVGEADATDVKAAPPKEKTSYQVIEGGEAQSADPTAYNYVPKENSTPGKAIQPLSASGYQPINGFGFTYKGNNFKVTTG